MVNCGVTKPDWIASELRPKKWYYYIDYTRPVANYKYRFHMSICGYDVTTGMWYCESCMKKNGFIW